MKTVPNCVPTFKIVYSATHDAWIGIPADDMTLDAITVFDFLYTYIISLFVLYVYISTKI